MTFLEKLGCYAARMRATPTEAEFVLWGWLQYETPEWHFQSIQCPYILDFYCPQRRLGVEVDGRYHSTPEQSALDAKRTEYLRETYGISITRYTNHQVCTRVLYVGAELGYDWSTRPVKTPEHDRTIALPWRMCTGDVDALGRSFRNEAAKSQKETIQVRLQRLGITQDEWNRMRARITAPAKNKITLPREIPQRVQNRAAADKIRADYERFIQGREQTTARGLAAQKSP